MTSSAVSASPLERPPTGIASSRRPLTTTERNWGLALGLTAAFLGLLWVVGQLERGAGLADKSRMFVANASETAARILAVVHTIVATAFMATSRRVRTGNGVLWFAALALLSVGVCFGYSSLATWNQSLAAVFFTAYFLVHDVRDEAFFYAANGDAKGGGTAVARPVLAAMALVTAALVATLGVAVLLGLGGARRYMGGLAALALPLRGALAAALLAGLLLAVRAVGRASGIRGREAWRTFLSLHRPLVLVYAGVYLALFVGLWITDRLYVIVSLHIILWWIFAGRNLARAPRPVPAPRPFTWRWVKQTPLGFHVFHGGILVALVAAAAVWAFAYRNASSMDAYRFLVGKNAFYYWTLVHVTLSWIPRA